MLHAIAQRGDDTDWICNIDHSIYYHPDKSGELKVRVKVKKESANVPWMVGLLDGNITVETIHSDIVPVIIRPGKNTTIRLGKMVVKSLHGIGDHNMIV